MEQAAARTCRYVFAIGFVACGGYAQENCDLSNMLYRCAQTTNNNLGKMKKMKKTSIPSRPV